jgi:hypothetical protein
MPNGGPDNCGTCGFNRGLWRNPEPDETQTSFCEIRGVAMSGTTLRMCGAHMSRAMQKARSRSRAASTAFSFSMTAQGGGSSPSTGKVKTQHARCRKSI